MDRRAGCSRGSGAGLVVAREFNSPAARTGGADGDQYHLAAYSAPAVCAVRVGRRGAGPASEHIGHGDTSSHGRDAPHVQHRDRGAGAGFPPDWHRGDQSAATVRPAALDRLVGTPAAESGQLPGHSQRLPADGCPVVQAPSGAAGGGLPAVQPDRAGHLLEGRSTCMDVSPRWARGGWRGSRS